MLVVFDSILSAVAPDGEALPPPPLPLSPIFCFVVPPTTSICVGAAGFRSGDPDAAAEATADTAAADGDFAPLPDDFATAAGVVGVDGATLLSSAIAAKSSSSKSAAMSPLKSIVLLDWRCGFCCCCDEEATLAVNQQSVVMITLWKTANTAPAIHRRDDGAQLFSRGVHADRVLWPSSGVTKGAKEKAQRTYSKYNVRKYQSSPLQHCTQTVTPAQRATPSSCSSNDDRALLQFPHVCLFDEFERW